MVTIIHFIAGEPLLALDFVKISPADGKVYRSTAADGYDFVVSRDYRAGAIIEVRWSP